MSGGDVIVFSGEVDSGRPVLGGSDEKTPKGARVPIQVLKTNLDALLASLHDLLPAKANTVDGGLRLDEIEVAVAVNGKGEVGFLGTGVEVGGEATLRLVFKR